MYCPLAEIWLLRCGWSEKGLELFANYVDDNTAVRKDKNTQAVEKKCLEMLKKKHKIVCHNHRTQMDLERSNRRKRKRGLAEDLEHKVKRHRQAIRPSKMEFDTDTEDDDLPPLAATSSKSFSSPPPPLTTAFIS